MTSDIGHVLRETRHRRGATLSEAARHTGVRETHLAALERDELEAYGIDPVYVRGILRTYAEYLDLDANALLAHHRGGGPQPSGRSGQVAPLRTQGGLRPAPARRSRSRRALTAVGGAALLLVVLAGAALAVLWWMGGQRPMVAEEGGATSEAPMATVATDAAAPSEDATDDGTSLDTPQRTEAADELTVKLESTDKVWVRVEVDGENKLEGIMRPGAVTQFTGKDTIELRIGVADAVELSLNGAWYGNVASSYEGPVNVTCTTDSSCKVTKVG